MTENPATEEQPEEQLPLASLRELGIENYQITTVKRGDLKDAPYNPRVLSETARRKLRKGLERHGLVAPLTYNVRTGHIVGGHQRLHIIDSLTHKSDYELQVAQIDVDEAREKELNLLLNNSQAMGEWNLDDLGALLQDSTLNLDGTGFEAADVFQLLGESGAGVLADRGDGALEQLSQRLQEVAAQYDEVQANSAKRDGVEYFIIVVFRDPEDCTDFLRRAGLPDNRYQSGLDLRRLTNLPEAGQGEPQPAPQPAKAA